MLRVTGINQWLSLAKVVTDKGVMFDKMPDYPPHNITQGRFHMPIFSEAHSIFVKLSDKNWLFYYLNQDVFPMAERIVLDTHPCDAGVMERFPNMYLTDRFRRFSNENTRIISQKEFEWMEKFWTLELMKK